MARKMFARAWPSGLARLAALFALVAQAAWAADPAADAAPAKRPLTQRQFLQAVVANNADIAYTRLQADVAATGADAEATLYTPTLYSTLRREMRERQRTFDEKTSSLVGASTNVLDEEVRSAEVGLRVKAPTGAEVSVGVRGNAKQNNLLSASPSTGGVETSGSLVLTLRQPLWRGAGREHTETDLKLAELERDIGRAQYRQQLLRVGADSLTAYWQLQRAYATHPLRELLLVNARETVADVRLREGAGRLPAAAEAEAGAALALREAEVARSRQGVLEAEVRLAALLNLPPDSAPWLLDRPPLALPVAAAGPISEERLNAALEQWPAWRVAQMRIEQGRRRLAYAREQTRPQLDLQASYAATGLARTPGGAMSTMGHGRYPDWYVGVTFEMPLGMRTRGDAQLQGQQLKLQQAELEARTVRHTLTSDLYSRQQQLELTRRELQGLEADTGSRRVLLDNETRAWRDGLAARSRVLRREGEWLESRLRLVDAQTRLQVALVLLAQAEGRLLHEHGVEFEL